jgi:hypothetical protein
LHGIRRKTGWGSLFVACAAITACDDVTEPEPATFLPAPATAASGCVSGGYLRGTLFGALDGEIDWSDSEFDCEGMPRPDGAGARLRFAGSGGGQALALIIAMPDLEQGAAAAELPSNVTIIEEGSGRFFSTPGLESCWTDIDAQTPVDDATDTYAISGTLYCITPVPEVNGDSSVSLRELHFGGQVNWSAQ